jgi:hypothetical protein
MCRVVRLTKPNGAVAGIKSKAREEGSSRRMSEAKIDISGGASNARIAPIASSVRLGCVISPLKYDTSGEFARRIKLNALGLGGSVGGEVAVLPEIGDGMA